MHIHTLKKFSYWEWNFPGATCIAGNKCTETVSANQLPKGTVLWPYFVVVVGGGEPPDQLLCKDLYRLVVVNW